MTAGESKTIPKITEEREMGSIKMKRATNYHAKEIKWPVRCERPEQDQIYVMMVDLDSEVEEESDVEVVWETG